MCLDGIDDLGDLLLRVLLGGHLELLAAALQPHLHLLVAQTQFLHVRLDGLGHVERNLVQLDRNTRLWRRGLV